MDKQKKQPLRQEGQGARQPEHSVSPLFLNRWSSRSFTDQPVSEDDLYTILEAAHWSPSSFNDQPWRFFVAHTEEHLPLFRSFLNEFNYTWASRAPVLLVIASDTLRPNGSTPNRAHAFDAGAAWASLALQASMLGLVAHAMGGFDRDKVRNELSLPETYAIHAMVALGYRGEPEDLPAALREEEKPNTRNRLSAVVTKGPFY
ncbi:nitroreductase family protein [Bacillaceae bacterium SIJ1]|uniref:nitroreductase family protein n=1 Tax=Litoribacterium kuwaitense TaxID=1398745 RepID=UPI0013EB082A|nr:nitroreductase family protein [Litoribacterium kuwaitense]NGP44912.1 nitroreductase family protein [Litoribacterium kuwaitense]